MTISHTGRAFPRGAPSPVGSADPSVHHPAVRVSPREAPSRAGVLRVLAERATRDTDDVLLQALDVMSGAVGLDATPEELHEAIAASRGAS